MCRGPSFSRCQVSILAVALVLVGLLAACDRSQVPDDHPVESADEQPRDDEDGYEVSYPRTALECTEQNRQEIEEWLTTTAPMFEHPHTQACDGPPYPSGPLRSEEKKAIGEVDDYFFVSERLLEQLGELDERTQPRLFAEIHEHIQFELARLDEAGTTDPEAVIVPAPPDMEMEQLELLFGVMKSFPFESEDFDPIDLPVLALLVADDVDELRPEGVEPIPAEARDRVDAIVDGDVCDVPTEQYRNFEAAIDEAVAPCANPDQFDMAMTRSPELAEFWKECDCEVDIEFLIAANHYKWWHDEGHPVSVLEFELSPEGETVNYRSGDSWQEVVDELQTHHGEVVDLGIEPAEIQVEGDSPGQARADDAEPEEDATRRGLELDVGADPSDESPGSFDRDPPPGSGALSAIAPEVVESSDDADGGLAAPESEEAERERRDLEDLDPNVEVGAIEEIEVEGPLDGEIIRRVALQHRRAIQHCYARHLKGGATPQGDVTFEFRISPTGDVVTASLEETTLDHTDIEKCAAQRIQQWRFPEPEGGGLVRVELPLEFEVDED